MFMEKVYQSQKHEEKIYRLWEKKGYFTPKIDPTKKPFVITLPPPNVTGGLHAGHAMCATEDILARYYRMKGKPTLFLPGFDHASIAVEYLIGKQLIREGKTKQEIGRKEFLKRAQNFAQDSRQYIRKQLKKLGFSLDWTREAYTMDKNYSQAVQKAFKHLYQRNLIYQGEYIVNWCPNCQTAISDLENEYQEEKGKLYYIKYGPITIATTRPETMFADVAVAVHPKNKKYKKLVGKLVPLPLANRKIPIIKDKAVDLEFGTGALKITPAHDQLDFEIGQRHQLEKLTVINHRGELNKLAGQYAGLSIEKGRQKVVNDLQKANLIEKIEAHVHNVGHCQRCGKKTEPLLSKQWFVKTKSLAEKATQAVKEGQIKIIPKRFEKIYFRWLNNIHDWCISRQLWWGHKIPLKGEKDILDTWFSSALWPIAVFGWPEKTKDFKYFYPTTIRETGYDILFFWVTKEIMMCLAMTNKIPFKTVYLHGLVRDEEGKKFSKTKNIGFDPLDIIQKYGADSLRMALIAGNAPGNDLKIDEEKVIAYRNFTNKIWNAARFIVMNRNIKNQKPKTKNIIKNSKLEKQDKKMIKIMNNLITSVTKDLDNFRFDLAAGDIYQVFWHEFCDRYIESTKSRQNDPATKWILLISLKTFLKLLHPFMPFITETVWSRLKTKNEPDLIIAPWPKKITV